MKCTFTQWILSSRLDAERSVPGWVLRHAASCDNCQKVQEQLYDLDARLRDGKSALPPAQAKATAPLRWGFAAAAVAAVCAVLVISQPSDDSPDSSVAVPQLPHAPSGKSAFARYLAPAARKAERASLLALETEWDRVVADGRAGMKHVLRLAPLD